MHNPSVSEGHAFKSIVWVLLPILVACQGSTEPNSGVDQMGAPSWAPM
jgi:hypothetical protein